MTVPSDMPLLPDFVRVRCPYCQMMFSDRRPRPPGEAVEAGAMIIFGNDLAWPQMLEKNRERYREKARAVLALASPQEKI